MRTALLAGSVSFAANLLILSVFIPFTLGFRTLIIGQIAFWTFFAATGAVSTMALLQKRVKKPTRIFYVLAAMVFFLSLIPIYLQAGILQDFPPEFLSAITHAISTMHVVDSLTITALVISFAR
jgi:hypothetical protein